MAMNSVGRPTTPVAHIHAQAPTTFSGARGLLQPTSLIYEQGSLDRTGVDLPTPKGLKDRLGGTKRTSAPGNPGLSEPEAVRHYVRLSQRNYAIDLGMFPLGSCTMKHNARLNEKMARLPGFADVHPLQPISTVQGALGVMNELSHWLITLTGMTAVALSPKAGAHGELCGMLAIRAALDANGQTMRKRVLVPESAHGTNPATAVQCGFIVDEIKASADGRVDMEDFKRKLVGDDVAGIMLTNPNTCGLFERDIREIADLIHAAGGYFYCDGANFNAIAGRVRPGDLGVDAMHINLHKTFSTPHGGGGPGSGPTVLSDALASFAPVPYVVTLADGTLDLVEHDADAEGNPFGRMVAFHGQMGMYTRALTYMLSHGADGIKQASEDAVLNANYVQSCLRDVMSAAFDGVCMHEALFDDSWLEGTGVTTLDFAKAMIDEGYHPMTMYFPLVVRGAMLIEPTESESKASLDAFIASMRGLANAAKTGDTTRFTGAPYYAPVKRLDETRAARKPVLKWTPPVAEVSAIAAE